MKQGIVPNQHLITYNWSRQRLQNQVVVARNRFEYSLYGPLLYLLLSQFPEKRMFMICPQAGFRKLGDLLDPGYVIPPNTHQKKSSHGTNFISNEVARRLPDYIICKGNSEVGNDIILCIFEVKRDGDSQDNKITQIKNYLRRAAEEELCVGKLYGFLVLGDKTKVYYINAEQYYHQREQHRAGLTAPQPRNADDLFDGNFQVQEEPEVDTDSVQLMQKLQKISLAFWNNAAANWFNFNYF